MQDKLVMDARANVIDMYHKALSSAWLYVEPEAGYVRLGGDTRMDFLQKQSTNNMELLGPARGLTTVLTSPTARILDVLTLFDEGDAIGVVPLPGRAGATVKFLRSRVFFMDRVQIDDQSEMWSQVWVGGPRSVAAIETLIGQAAPVSPGDVLACSLPVGTIRIMRLESASHASYLIRVPRGGLAGVLNLLTQAGAVEVQLEVHEILRVEAGAPGPAHELTEDFTPLEAGLDTSVAQGKGCYTGQEIIARQLTYDKVVQHLVGLRLTSPAIPGEALFNADRRVGVVTSVVESPRYGTIGLGYVRRPDNEPGTMLHVESNVDAVVTLAKLPFEPE